MSGAVTSTRWPSLTAALDDVDGPPRRFLDRVFPHRRPLQDAYRQSAGPIRVLGGAANAGTIGTAFDVWVQLQIQPCPDLSPAMLGALLAGEDAIAGYEALSGRLGPVQGNEPWQGPWAGLSSGYDERDLLRFCWAAACTTPGVHARQRPRSGWWRRTRHTRALSRCHRPYGRLTLAVLAPTRAVQTWSCPAWWVGSDRGAPWSSSMAATSTTTTT